MGFQKIKLLKIILERIFHQDKPFLLYVLILYKVGDINVLII